jgi:hypothetical protein
MLAHWLAPLTTFARMLDLKDIPISEALTKIIKASVCAQVESVAGTALSQAFLSLLE